MEGSHQRLDKIIWMASSLDGRVSFRGVPWRESLEDVAGKRRAALDFAERRGVDKHMVEIQKTRVIFLVGKQV